MSGSFNFDTPIDEAPAAVLGPLPGSVKRSGGSFSFEPSDQPLEGAGSEAAPGGVDQVEVPPGVDQPEDTPRADQAEVRGQLDTVQFDKTGAAIPGSVAEKLGVKPHPSTLALLQQTYDMTKDIDGNRLAFAQYVADKMPNNSQTLVGEDGTSTTEYRITPKMLEDMPRRQLDQLLEQAALKNAIKLDNVIARRLAEDAEAVAILKGDLSAVFAAAGAMATMERLRGLAETGGRRNLTAWEEVYGKGAAPHVNQVEGIISAVGRGMDMQGAALHVQSALAALGMGLDPDEAARQFTAAKDKMNEAMARPRSTDAMAFLKLIKKVDDLPGEDVLPYIAKIIANNPVEAAALIQEVTAEQALPMGASMVATAFGTPVAGVAVMALATWLQEANAFSKEALDNIQAKHGHDLNTKEGIDAFVRDARAVAEFKDFGMRRAAPIVAGTLVTAGVFRALSMANISKIAKVAGGVTTGGVLEGAGEALAQLLSEGKLTASEIALEALAGAHPVTVGIEAYIAGAADIRDAKEAKAVKIWLKSGEATAEKLRNIPVEKLNTAASVLADKLKSEGIETVYIPADQLMAFDQDEGVTETLGLTSEAVKQAARDGQDVAIDAATYIRHILGKDGFAALQRHTKFTSGGMTAAEAEQYEADDVGGKIREEMQRVAMARVGIHIDPEQLTKLEADTAFIRESMTAQLEATGAYTPKKASLLAQVAAQSFATEAVALTEADGRPVDALALYNLHIQGGDASRPPRGILGGQAVFESTAREFGVTPDQLRQELDAAGGDLTQTPRFKAWFGDSKIMDGGGKPLVVYHGSDADIQSFQPAGSEKNPTQPGFFPSQPGFYFTADPDYADIYRGKNNDWTRGTIYPVYLSIKNPMVIEDFTFWEKVRARVTRVKLRVPLGDMTSYMSKEKVAKLRAQGFDGIVNKKRNEIIVFEPTQIKSAIGNTGAFDPNDPSILNQDAANAGFVITPEQLRQKMDAARGKPVKNVLRAAVKRLGAKLSATSRSGSRYYTLPDGRGFRLSDHTLGEGRGTSRVDIELIYTEDDATIKWYDIENGQFVYHLYELDLNPPQDALLNINDKPMPNIFGFGRDQEAFNNAILVLLMEAEENTRKFGHPLPKSEAPAAPDPTAAPAAVELEQTGKANGPRGRFIPSDSMPDQDGNPINLIQIFEKADATTFLHEVGHFWLERLKSNAGSVGKRFQKDFDSVVAWWGSNSLSIKDEAIRRAKKKGEKDHVIALQGMTDEQVKAYIKLGDLRGEGHTRWISVAMHEQWARGTETYFATGKSPSIRLAAAFNAFKVWIASVFRRMQGSGDVVFSKEVSGVMDRILASDEEISAANGLYAMTPLLSTAEEAGMTPADFQKYQEKVTLSVQQSRANQLAKHMGDAARQKTDEWETDREGFREQVESDVAMLQYFRLIYILAEGGLADGSSADPIERVPPMDQEALVKVLEEHGMSLKDLPRVGSKSIYQKSKEEGDTSSPGIVAATFGYADVTAMLVDLLDAGKYATAVEAALDAKMKAEFGSIDDTGDQAAIASIHGDHTADVLAAELEALRSTEPAFKAAFIKQYAIDQMAKMKTSAIQHHLFSTAERNHAKAAGRALKKGDRAEAYRHQFQRLVNHRLASEALKAREALDKKSIEMKKLQKPKKRPKLEKGYQEAIQSLLEMTDFSPPISERKRLHIELALLNEFIQKAEEDDGAVLQIPEWLLNKDSLINVRDMTYQQFIDLHESVKSLEKQGMLAKKLRIGNENKDRTIVLAQLQSRLAGRDQTKVSKILGKWQGPPAGLDAALVNAGKYLASMDAGLLRVEFLLEALDGEPLGPWHQAVYQPFIDAMNKKSDMTKEVLDLIQGQIRNMPKAVRKGLGRRVDTGALGLPGAKKMTRSSLIMLILNTGNASNLDKTIRGMGGDGKDTTGLGWNINEKLLDEATQLLTKEEMDFIQSIWDHADKMKGDAFSIYEKENGVRPAEVVPRTITTRFGTYAGGYFPMMYDTTRPYDSSAARQAERTALEQMQATVGRGSVNSSFTQSRTSFAAPILLDFEQITTGLDNTIHFITHYDAVRNVSKILRDKPTRFMLENTVGKEYATMLDLWVSVLASNGGDRPPITWMDRSAAWLAKNTTMAVLGFSYTTLSAQVLGLTSALDRLMADQETYGPITLAEATKDLAYGLAMAASPENYRVIISKSILMRDRRDNYDRDVQKVLKAARNRVKDKLTTINDKTIFEWGMRAIAEAQFFCVDVPVWTAAYNRALRNDPGNDAGAIAYADRTVRLSQSSGNVMDLSQTHRDAVGTNRVFVMFYTWFSALYGMLHEVSSDFRKNVRSTPAAAISRAATRLFVLLTLQAIGMALIRGELPDWEEPDPKKDNMLTFLLKDTLKTALGTVPLVRDIANGALSDFGYGGSPVSIFGDAFSQLVKSLGYFADPETPEVDSLQRSDALKKLKPMIVLGGVLTRAPAIQGNRTLDGLAAFFDEAHNWHWGDLFRGYDEKRAEKRGD